ARRERARARAERPHAGRGWERPLGIVLLTRLFEAFPELASTSGLLLSPFVAQLARLRDFVEERGLESWRASTVHAEQGAEAEVVVFDPVHAGSTAWDEIEWRRLVNVGLSRARASVLLLASRDELRQPFLRPLIDLMGTYRLRRGQLERIDLADVRKVSERRNGARAPGPLVREGHRLGAQIAHRRNLHALPGHEQERLSHMTLDEGPRLVRGVAGSGKTWVAAHWAIRSLVDAPAEARLLFVYGNQALHALIDRSLAAVASELGIAWPDRRLELRHAGEVLLGNLPRLQIERWDYDAMATALATVELEPAYDALFIDEAQDFGEAALRQLFRLVRARRDARGGELKAIRMF
ncbi:MAG: hypothetical protein H5U40_16735, partial [Polyangiaceae bacterium]|nr:hypothetical protein [Polyangiaceae bacterium]